MIYHEHYEEVSNIEKGDTVVVVATPGANGDVYYDLGRAAVPEESRTASENDDIDRLARLYNEFRSEGVDDAQAAQKLAVTVFLNN